MRCSFECRSAARRPRDICDVVGARRRYGYLAVGVRGTAMVPDHALIAYGKLGRVAVMAPAIALARDVFVLGEADAAIIAARADRLGTDREAARIFLKPDGTPS